MTSPGTEDKKSASPAMVIFIITMVTIAGIGQLLIKHGVTTFEWKIKPKVVEQGYVLPQPVRDDIGESLLDGAPEPDGTEFLGSVDVYSSNGEYLQRELFAVYENNTGYVVTSGLEDGDRFVVTGRFPNNLWDFIIMCFYWPVFIGLVIYFIFGVSWLKILADVPVSFAFPFLSIGYIVIILGTWLLFHENINWLKLVSIALIVAGVICLSRSDTAETGRTSSPDST